MNRVEQVLGDVSDNEQAALQDQYKAAPESDSS